MIIHTGFDNRLRPHRHVRVKDELPPGFELEPEGRATLILPLLSEGARDCTYVAAVTAVGRFVVPPASVEELLSPDVLGKSGADLVVVE